MRISTRLIYSPFLLLYAMGPLVHDIIPYQFKLNLRVIGGFSLLYLIGLVSLLPIYMLIRNVEKKRLRIRRSIVLRMIASLSFFSVPYFVFWGDWSLFYISLVLSVYASLVCMIAWRKDVSKRVTLLRDSDTGNYYRVKGGLAYRLSDNEVSELKGRFAGRHFPVVEFASTEIIGFDNQSNVIPVNSGASSYNHSEISTGMYVNPSSGMPMIGGISGIDIHGNSWGTNFNEPSNHYDPNRGY